MCTRERISGYSQRRRTESTGENPRRPKFTGDPRNYRGPRSRDSRAAPPRRARRAPHHVRTIRAPSCHRGHATRIPPGTRGPRHTRPALAEAGARAYPSSRTLPRGRTPAEIRRVTARSWRRAPARSLARKSRIRIRAPPRREVGSVPSRVSRPESRRDGRDPEFAEARAISPAVNNTSVSLFLSLPLSTVSLTELSRGEAYVRAQCLPSNTERFAERVYLGTSNTRNVSGESFLPFSPSCSIANFSPPLSSPSREARLIFARGGLQRLCPSVY